MGRLDQFAKDTFAIETPAVTHGAVSWQLPPELGLSEVRLDGLMRVLDHAPLATLLAPWSLIRPADELILEVKMPGDHLDLVAFDRAMLRRLARQIQRREDTGFDGESLLWFVAAHVPMIIRARRPVVEVAPGCYRVGPDWMATFWIAANELPLADDLVPFLIARTGNALDAFARWVVTRRSLAWLSRMLESLPMSTATYEELRYGAFEPTDDPEVRARQHMILDWVLGALPEERRKLREEGALEVELRTERRMLRDVLAARGLALDVVRFASLVLLGREET